MARQEVEPLTDGAEASGVGPACGAGAGLGQDAYDGLSRCGGLEGDRYR